MTETPCNILLYEMGCSNNLFLIYKIFIFFIIPHSNFVCRVIKKILLIEKKKIEEKFLQIGPVGIQKICS